MIYRGIAQLVEQRSPKPRAEGSSPSAPASKSLVTVKVLRLLFFYLLMHTEFSALLYILLFLQVSSP